MSLTLTKKLVEAVTSFKIGAARAQAQLKRDSSIEHFNGNPPPTAFSLSEPERPTRAPCRARRLPTKLRRCALFV
jgi:hypothetical protein